MVVKLSKDELLESILFDPKRKHSVTVRDHRTAISLEDVFWNALKDIAASLVITISLLVEKIDAERGRVGLSAAVRKFVFKWVAGERSCGL